MSALDERQLKNGAPEAVGGGWAVGAVSQTLPPPAHKEEIIPNPKLKLLDQMREVLRLKHYSIRTERCYCAGP